MSPPAPEAQRERKPRKAADIDGQKHGTAPEGVLHGAVHIIIHSGDELRAQQRACEGEYPAEHSETSAHQLSSSLRSCSCTVIRNAGHLVHEEKPDRIAELVRGFIPAGYDN